MLLRQLALEMKAAAQTCKQQEKVSFRGQTALDGTLWTQILSLKIKERKLHLDAKVDICEQALEETSDR